jgi:hypothetical protein
MSVTSAPSSQAVVYCSCRGGHAEILGIHSVVWQPLCPSAGHNSLKLYPASSHTRVHYAHGRLLEDKQNPAGRFARLRPMEENMRALCICPMSRPAAVIGALICFGVSAPACANVITDWDERAVAVITPMMVASFGTNYPVMGVRMMAMVHAAMFDAVNSIERRYRPYLVQLPAERTTSEEAAAATAAAEVLATINPKTARWHLRPTSPQSPMGPRN